MSFIECFYARHNTKSLVSNVGFFLKRSSNFIYLIQNERKFEFLHIPTMVFNEW